MKKRFSDDELTSIIEQSMFYQCACPAQVVKAVRNLRALYDYQHECLEQSDTDAEVHQRIALDSEHAHRIMEACLDSVLEIEGWDKESMTMPKSLMKTLRQDQDT